MAAALNAIDAITPAWNRAFELMFKPWRWSFWWRMAFLAFITGEVSSGGNFNIPSDWNPRTRGGNDLLAAGPDPFSTLGPAAIAAIVLLVLVFVIVFMYFGCVFRFVLFDAVLTGRYRLREGFGRWQHFGTKFFWWSLGYLFVVMAVAIPLVLMIAGGFSRVKGTATAAGILLIVVGFLLALVAIIAASLIFVLTKDFVIPIMAFNHVDTMDGWSILKQMIKSDPLSYLGYIGMKIVLAMGAGIVMMIATVVVVIFIGLPIGIVIALIVAAAFAANKIVGIMLAVVLIGIAVLVFMFLMGLLGVPVASFFQAYAIQFFGRRFRPMELVLYPEPPPAPPAAPAMPEPPPMPPEPGPAPA